MNQLLNKLHSPSNKTEATITLITVTCIVVSYVIWTDFFISCSILLAFLAPLFLAIYIGSKMSSRALDVIFKSKATV